jgi:hypothetical protein
MPKTTPYRDRDHGRYAAGLFAATVVMTVGLGVCLMLTFLFAPDAWWSFALIGGAIAAFSVTLWLFSGPAARPAQTTNFYTVDKEQVDEYAQSLRPRRRRRPRVEFGTNKPPTIDDLRQIKEDSNVWFPSERRADEYRRNLGQS